MAVHPVHEALSSQYVKRLLSVKAYQLSRKLGVGPDERPDLEQDLMAHVVRQAHHFDPSRRKSVRTFIARVIDSAFRMTLRSRLRQKRAGEMRVMSLERTHVQAGGIGWVRLWAVVDEADLRRRYGGSAGDDPDLAELCTRVRRALAGLPAHHQRVAEGLATCDGEASVARQMGISRRQVRKAMDAIREHLTRAGLTES